MDIQQCIHLSLLFLVDIWTVSSLILFFLFDLSNLLIYILDINLLSVTNVVNAFSYPCNHTL